MARGRGHRRGVLIMRHARRGGMGPLGTILITATDSPNETREGHQFESMQILAADGSGASLATGQRRRAPLATITFQPRHGRACPDHRPVVRAAASGSVDVRSRQGDGDDAGNDLSRHAGGSGPSGSLDGHAGPLPGNGPVRSATRSRERGVKSRTGATDRGQLPERETVCLADVADRRMAMHRDGVHLLRTVLDMHGNDGHRLDVRPDPRRHP